VTLTFRKDTTTVRRDDSGLVKVRQNAIIRVGRQGSAAQRDAHLKLAKALKVKPEDLA
jgi:hypothetical protein